MLRGCLVVLLAVLAVPSLAVAGAHYARDAVLNVEWATPALNDGHFYDLRVAPGDSIRATISWSDPLADLDLLLRPVEPGCLLLPIPDAACIAGRDHLCSASRVETALGPGSETRTIASAPFEQYVLSVHASFATEAHIPYHIDVVVDGEGGAVSGPLPVRFVGATLACKLPTVG